MEDLAIIPILLLVIPLLGIGAISFGAPNKLSAMLAVSLNFLLSLVLAFTFKGGTSQLFHETNQVFMKLDSLFQIHFHLGVDGLNLPLVLLTTVVSLAAVFLAPSNVRRANEFFICLLLVIVGALGAFLSFDLFFLYVFHEVALIPTFLLIGIWGNHDRKFAAMQMTLYLMLGSLILLAGLLAFYFQLPEPTFDLVSIREQVGGLALNESIQNYIYPLLLVGFGILVSLVPFHSWAPKGYANAPVSAVMLHAGVLKKFGLYGLLRVAVPYFPEGMQYWELTLLVLIGFHVLYVGLVTIAQKDLNMMLGYSSVMHMGYLFLGFASYNVIGLSGMVILMVAHGLSAALLFGLSGAIRERAGTSHLKEMGGLAQKAPFLACMFIVGAMASLGLPGLGNFAGEILIFFGGWKAFWDSHMWVMVCAIWGVVISAVYLLRAVRDIFFGEMSETIREAKDIQCWGARIPYLLLAISLLLVGFFPKVISGWAEPVIATLLAGAS